MKISVKPGITVTILAIIALWLLWPGRVSAHTGFGMVVDRQGRVVFLDSGRSHVWRIESGGQLTALATDKHADPLVLDAEGNLFVEHLNETLWKIAPDGRVTEVSVPKRRSGARVGSLDELLAIDRQGNFYFSGGNEFYQDAWQIRKMTLAGETTVLAGSLPGHTDGRGGEARFAHLRSAAWGPDGALYVTDEHSVRRVSMDGTVVTLAGGATPGFADRPGPTARFERVLGLSLDAQGNDFVVDTDNFRLRKISPDGHVSTILQTQPPWKPAGVAVAGDMIYVLELKLIPLPVVSHWFTTHRVRQIKADGTITTLATVGGSGGIISFGAAGVLLFATWRFWRRRRRRKAAGQGQPV